MALIKMGQAARRANAGSTSTIQRALREAGVPLVILSPGVVAVEEADLERFLAEREARKQSGEPAAPKPKTPRPKTEAKIAKSKKRRG